MTVVVVLTDDSFFLDVSSVCWYQTLKPLKRAVNVDVNHETAVRSGTLPLIHKHYRSACQCNSQSREGISRDAACTDAVLSTYWSASGNGRHST
jgi:hypothetical protein